MRMILVPKMQTRRRWMLGCAVYFPQLATWLFPGAAAPSPRAINAESWAGWRKAVGR